MFALKKLRPSSGILRICHPQSFPCAPPPHPHQPPPPPPSKLLSFATHLCALSRILHEQNDMLCTCGCCGSSYRAVRFEIQPFTARVTSSFQFSRPRSFPSLGNTRCLSIHLQTAAWGDSRRHSSQTKPQRTLLSGSLGGAKPAFPSGTCLGGRERVTWGPSLLLK